MNGVIKIAPALLLLASTTAAAEDYKGTVKPNWWLADFNKRDEAYYLSLDQIRVGATEAAVIEAFGKKYQVVNSEVIDGMEHETWKFTSYRARQFSDPVDKFVTVEFRDGLVVNASERVADGSAPAISLVQDSQNLAPPDAVERMAQLQQLFDRDLITSEEYEAKKKELLEAL